MNKANQTIINSLNNLKDDYISKLTNPSTPPYIRSKLRIQITLVERTIKQIKNGIL